MSGQTLRVAKQEDGFLLLANINANAADLRKARRPKLKDFRRLSATSRDSTVEK
jgi:hypothetical protein